MQMKNQILINPNSPPRSPRAMPEYLYNVANGERVELTTLWRNRRILLVFLRHLGCRFCRSHIGEITSIKHKLDKYDIQIVFIALGDVDSSKHFLQIYGNPPGEFYLSTDSIKDDINGAAGAYAIMKLERSMEKTLSGKFTEMADIALKNGHNDTPYLGGSKTEYPLDSSQLGGVFIIGPGNYCEYSYRSQYGGDTPDLDELLKYAKQSKKNYAKRFMSVPKGSADSSSSSSSGEEENIPQDKEEEEKRKASVSISSTISVKKTKFVNPRTQEWVEKMQMNEKVVEEKKVPTSQTVMELLKSLIESPHSIFLAAAFTLTFYNHIPKSVIASLVAGCITFALVGIYQNKKVVNSVASFVKTNKIIKDLSNTLLNETASVPRPKGNLSDIRLFTPEEIDRLVVEAGSIDCDCPTVVMDIPVSGKVEIDFEQSVSPNGTTVYRPRANTFSKSDKKPLSNTELTASAQMLCFLREFLAKPHPLLGRKGPVCPFIPTALRKNTVWMAIVRTGPEVTPDDMASIVQPFAEKFCSLEPKEGTMSSYKAICILFPDIQVADARSLIDGTQEKLKPVFVEKSLMIGEFHKQNNAAGLRNPDFYPLRTPIPTLAIRHMVTGDIAFLDMSKYAPKIRVSFLTSYLSRFEAGEDAPRTLEMLERAKGELKKAQDELAKEEN